MKTNRPLVGVIMGSDSDWQAMEPAIKTLKHFGIPHETRVISAHRTPATAAEYASGAAGRGIHVLIAAAGGAAHLAGVLAAHTILPVIGVPMKGGALDGLDALLSTVQMPAGIPVATVALGSSGPVNAAVLAAQIIALQSPETRALLERHKKSLKAKVANADQKVREKAEKI